MIYVQVKLNTANFPQTQRLRELLTHSKLTHNKKENKQQLTLQILYQ